MNTIADLALIGALAAVWLAAGLVADAMPAITTAGLLHRRARLLSALVEAGVATFVAVPVIGALVPGPSAAPVAALLPAAPAVVVLTVTVRRLNRVRRGAAAFVSAPGSPAPPALRAAAAHPLMVTPLQVTGLAALAGVPVAAGLVSVPGTAVVATVAVSVTALSVGAIGIRHAMRHNRLRSSAVALVTVRSAPTVERIPR